MLKGGQHPEGAAKRSLQLLQTNPSTICPLLLLGEPPAAHQERFQHEASAPDPHCPRLWNNTPNQRSHKQLSSTSSPHTAAGLLPAQPCLHPCIPSHLTLAWASCCRTKLSADSLSLAIRVSHVSFTSVRISSALGMLSEALEEKERGSEQPRVLCHWHK